MLVRFALQQNRATTERFVGFLERSLRRQEEINERFQFTLDSIGSAIRDCVARLDQIHPKP